MDEICYSIGIDLGTSSTHAAVLSHDTMEDIVSNDWIKVPSYVAFTPTGCLVGELAELQADQNPLNTIFDALRFLGRTFRDPEMEELIEQYPFRVIDNHGSLAFKVIYRGAFVVVTPVEVLSMILDRCRSDMITSIPGDSKVGAVTISVPVCFDFCQRQLVRDAAQIANLGTVHIIDCSSAACLQYSLSCSSATGGSVLVLDCGAGFLDITIATEAKGTIVVKEAYGTSLHGSEDVDSILLKLLLEKIRAASGKPKLLSNLTPQQVYRLRAECRSVKTELSSHRDYYRLYFGRSRAGYWTETYTRGHKIDMQELGQNSHSRVLLTISDLRRCYKDLLSKFDSVIPDLLLKAQMTTAELNTAIIMGGTSHAPLLHSMLCDLLGRQVTQKCLEADAATAQGAAYHAATMCITTNPAYGTPRMLEDARSATVFVVVNGIPKRAILRNHSSIDVPEAWNIPTRGKERSQYTVELWEGVKSRYWQNKCVGNFTILLLSAPQGLRCIWIRAESGSMGFTSIIAQHGTDSFQSVQKLFISVGLTMNDLSHGLKIVKSVSRSAEDRFVARYVTMSFVQGVVNAAEALQQSGDIGILPCRPQLEEIISSAEELMSTLWEDSVESATQHFYVRHRLRKLVENSLGDETAIARLMAIAEKNERSAMERLDSLTIAQKERVKSSLWTQANDFQYRAHHRSTRQFAFENDANQIFGHGRVIQADRKPDFISRESRLDGLVATEAADLDVQRPQRYQEEQKAVSRTDLRRASNETSETAKTQTIVVAVPEPSPVMVEIISKLDSVGNEYTDSECVQLSEYLRNSGKPDWSTVPRLYIVLKAVDHLELLDDFIKQGMYSIYGKKT